jgi:single-strand DNA-binding protein
MGQKDTTKVRTLAQLTLIAFVGGDAGPRTNSNGSQDMVFSIETETSWKNADGAWESRTEWHRCVANCKIDAIAATLTKGAHVHVEAELRNREYEKDG